jgi:hypothetical protein
VGGSVVGVENPVGGGDRQPAAMGHRIAGIGRQIDQARLELRRIDQHRPRFRGKVESNRNALAKRARQQPDRVRDQPVDVDTLRLQRLAAREGQQSARQVSPVQGGFQRIPDQFALFGVEATAEPQ